MIIRKCIQQINIMKSLQNKNPSSVSHSQLSTTTIQKRTAFKMVPSIFEPPQQAFPESLLNIKNQPSLRTKGSKNEDNDLQSQSSVYNYNGNNFNANVQFIGSLINVKDKVQFDEGDCIPIQSDDRWLVLVGEVRVVGHNGCAFGRGPGFVFFASAQTKRKVKQVLAISPVTALRLPHQTFKSQLRNYLYIKNSQKIKFLQYCPFLPQCQPYYEDIALTMQILEPIDKDQLIYQINSQANYLYWVKEGIVLLERVGKSVNQVIRDFQSYYQTSCVGEDEGIVIVRKGMIFGVDGVLIKEVVREVNLLDSQNPQDSTRPYQSPSSDPITLKQTRIYNAKSIGKCELYKLDKSILETYLKSTQKTFSNVNSMERDKDKKQNQLMHFSNKELDRLCLQYTNLLMGSNSVCKEVKKKNMELEVCLDDQEMDKKRKRVEEIKMQERKMKKVGKEEGKKDGGRDREQQEFPAMIRSPRKSKAESIKRVKDVSLPSLNKKYVQNLIFKKLETKQAEKYMGYKKKVQSLIFGKDYRGEIQKLEKAQRQQKAFQIRKERVGERQNQKQKDKEKDKDKQKQRQKEIKKIQNVQFMKVRSYRSLLSSLG